MNKRYKCHHKYGAIYGPLLLVCIGASQTTQASAISLASNNPPVALVDSVTVKNQVSNEIFVLANDFDPDGDPLKIVSISRPRHGSASINPGDTTLTYSSNTFVRGLDSLSYTISDDKGGQSAAQVIINVDPDNHAPAPFKLLRPGIEEPLILTRSMIGDSIQFVWESSFDADGDVITYFFHYFWQELLSDTSGKAITLDTTIYVHIDSVLIMEAIELGLTQIDGVCEVFAYDGQEGVFATGVEQQVIQMMLQDVADLPIQHSAAPKGFELHQNYPNPFNPTTRLEFELPRQVDVSLKVYDIMGRQVVTIVNETMNPGYHRKLWSGHDQRGIQVPSGIYIARLVTPEYSKSIKLVLMK